MLPSILRLRTRTVTRLFARPQTQKIPAYPFVFFVSQQMGRNIGVAQRGIQVANKLSKRSVRRHMVKRSFYDAVETYMRANPEQAAKLQGLHIMAVPQKSWAQELTQLLATADKTRIVQSVSVASATSLSQFVKKLWSSAESKTPSRPSRDVKESSKKTRSDSSKQ